MSKSSHEISRAQLMGLTLSPLRLAELITDTTNRVIGDELLLTDPFKSLAAEYLGFLAARLDARTEAAEIMANALPDSKTPMLSVGDLLYTAGHDLIGKYQRPDPDASDYPEGLPVDMAEDIARHTRFAIEDQLAQAYVDQLGTAN
ncbi:MAG TPA: hypothetical protein VF733_04350 [Candidatus Saccharimonadales bacterium]